MQITITLPENSPETGFNFEWEDGFIIKVNRNDNAILLVANKEGLISMARHFLNLAQDHFPSGYHLHLDEHNSLEEGSLELIITKA